MTYVNYPSVNKIVKAAGFVHINPTSIANEAGWGTKMGYISKDTGYMFIPNLLFTEYTTEETGSWTTVTTFDGAKPAVVLNFTSWQDEVMQTLFPGFCVSGKDAAINKLQLKTGVDFVATYPKNILFVPDDTTNDPAIYLNNAVPLNRDCSLIIHHSRETVFQVYFLANTVQWSLLASIVL